MVEEGGGVVVVGVGIHEVVDLVVVGDGSCVCCQVVCVDSRLGTPGNGA